MRKFASILSGVFCVLMCASAPSNAYWVSDSKPENKLEDKSEKIFMFALNMDDANAQSGEKSLGIEDGKKREIRREIIINRAPNGEMMNGAHIVRLGEKTVKNAAYSAEVTSERIQKLADGNVISSKTTSISYRDSQGRTREDIRDAKGEVREIIIFDPIEGRLILNPKTKTVTKLVSNFQTKDGGKMPMTVITENVSKSVDGKDVIALKLDEDAERLLGRRVEGGLDIKVERMKLKKPTTVDVHGPEFSRNLELHLGNVVSDSGFSRIFSDVKWSAKRQTKTLGSRDFDGVKAEGKMVTYEIPAGEIGNANPIIVSDESWTSPDLQITVYSRHSDPRSGDRIYRLNNLKRDEVPASMFVVPSDYKMRDLSKEIGKGTQIELYEKADKVQKIEREIKIEKK